MSRERTPGLDFDPRPIVAELEGKRGPLSWRQLGAEVGVSPSTFTRLRQGLPPDVVTLGRILTWLGHAPGWMR